MSLARQDEGQIEISQVNLPVYENPAEVVKRSGQWASALMEAVEQQKMYADMSGKKYLEVEAWQLVGMFANADAVPGHPIPIEKDGEIIGYECEAIVWQHGKIVGQGTMSCGLDAFPCRGKQGSEKNKAAMSAAQTWAISKALRNKFSFVAKLAGFEGTTADEMRGNDGASFGGNGADFCCKKEDFIGSLQDQMISIAKNRNDEVIEDLRKRWNSMSPAGKFEAVQSLQEPAEEAEDGIEYEDLDESPVILDGDTVGAEA
jgi:hypothetical protein